MCASTPNAFLNVLNMTFTFLLLKTTEMLEDGLFVYDQLMFVYCTPAF